MAKMGFLKELFEKKLKSGNGKDDVCPLEVSRSANSEYSLPQARQQAPFKGAAFPSNEVEPGVSATKDDDDPMCYLNVAPSAKSFSYAQVKKKQMDAADQLNAQVHEQQQNASRLSREQPVKYDSILQFSQKVELYRGSVSTVYKGVCTASNSKVIIKAYHKSKMHPKHHHKLQREIGAMRALNGPYVAQFFDTFEDTTCIYIIMEYCEGGDLFKTMLMHGGLLDEQWVCIEVITPLLRILEKMHAMKLLHRDIKPENIFLTSLGKFRLGDFGLAIKYDEEVPFSRSGTLDYMAPEVLKNPSVPFQEGKSVDVATLAARGVKPYGPPVDVWAAGVLAYELVCGRPPFEVEDESQTAALIMYSDAIKFPPNRSAQWADFVRAALLKGPDVRPSATALLQHPWIQHNLQRTLMDQHRPSKELLLQPLPTDTQQRYVKDLKRTMSHNPSNNSVSASAPSNIQAQSPTAHKHSERPRVEDLYAGSSSGSSNSGSGSGSKQASPLNAKRPSTLSMDGGMEGALSPRSPGGSARSSFTGAAGGLRPLKLALPADVESEQRHGDGLCYSPSTPVVKAGIKERMKVYFQRQNFT